MIATRLTVVLSSFSLSSSSRKLRVESKRTKKEMVRENFYMIKGSTFVRSLQTNNVYALNSIAESEEKPHREELISLFTCVVYFYCTLFSSLFRSGDRF